MKNENSVSEAVSFRYLLKNDIDNPHYHIVAFYGCDQYVEIFRFEILDLIKAACSKSHCGDNTKYYSNHYHLIKLLELAFVIRETTENFSLDEEHPLYRKNKGPFIWHEDNVVDLAGAGLNLRTLYGVEINNIRRFFDNFFSYMSLDQWCKILDDILVCAQNKTVLNWLCHSGCEIVFINEYLEKMIEAMFLVFNTTSLPYAKLHHASDFNFKIVMK